MVIALNEQYWVQSWCPCSRILVGRALLPVMLAPGGRLLICEPHVTRYHGPGDYFRFTRDGLAHLARTARLEIVEVAPIGGFWLQQHQQMAFYLDARLPRALPLRAAGRLALALLARWGAAVDCLLPSPNFAMAHLMVARKPGT